MESSEREPLVNDSGMALLASKLEALSAKVDALLAPAEVPSGDAGGSAPSEAGEDPAYLKSALAQRSVEAEDWMNAERAARQQLTVAEDALAKAQQALALEREDRAVADATIERLKEELDTLTKLLLEVEDREAHKLRAERLKADQYRDVAERLQTLCRHQKHELTNLRDRLAEAEAKAIKHQEAYLRTRRSVSWKVTAPLRNVLKQLKKLLKAMRG